MNLQLENGNTVNMVNNKYNIFYGPNKIGKTQISKALKKYYEDCDENVLLFDDDLLSNMSIQEFTDDNSFEIMPKVQEYNKYKNKNESSKKELAVKKNIKNICSTDTKKAFTDFGYISEFINDDVFTYKGDFEDPLYTEEEIKTLFKKPKTGLLNFFEIMDVLIKDGTVIIPEKIKGMVNIEIYNLQKKILDNSELYKKCPVCYNDITSESIELIRNSVENGTIDDTLKQSLLYYLENSDERINSVVSEFLISSLYEEEKNKIISLIQSSILYYLKDFYDDKSIENYLESKKELVSIMKEIKDFRLEETSETYEYIKNKIEQHSVYKNSDIQIRIEDGKLKITNSEVEYKNMSKSEQNFFKFLYFDILVYQKKTTGKLNIIVDDPFDSYDDIYVQDSINIIVNLINSSISDIDTFNVFSHSMYAIYLFDSINKNALEKFNIYWLDKLNNSNEILIYNDSYKLLSKMDVNPYDYGLILKICDKLVDKYSLITFASMLRNEINMERLLIKYNDEQDIKDIALKIDNIYHTISNSINHVKSDIIVLDLLNSINTIFKFNLNDNDNDKISDIFENITNSFDDIDIKVRSKSGNINLVDKKDVCYILIYKYLLGMKIRRIFESKVVNEVNMDYENIGDLIPYLNNDKLLSFYNTYNFVINSFNHSSSKIVPPIFVYSMNILQDIYDELVII